MGKHVVSILAALVITAVAPAAVASDGDGALCTITSDYGIAISPGLTLRPAEASIATVAPAIFECHGSVAGHRVTGPGSISYTADLSGPAGGATCQVATGRGEARITLPTANGPVELVNRFTFEALAGSGKFDGDTYSGVFSLVAVEGNCVTEPLTVVAAKVAGRLTYR